jgi:hypothetical protein
MRRIHEDQHPHTKIAVNNLARYSAVASGKAEETEISGRSDGKTSSFFTRIKRKFCRGVVQERLVKK